MSFILLLPLAIILIIYFIHFQAQKPKHGKTNHPPGPPGLPFIGNLLQFDGRLPHTYLHRLSNKYGPIMSLKLGFRRVVVISSAEAVKEIIKSHDAVCSSRPALVATRRLSYNGLDIAFSPYNDVWREMRKLSTIHLFSMNKIETFHPIFHAEVSKMIKKITRDASSSTITDLSETMMSFASNNICNLTFGKSYDVDEEYGKNSFIELAHAIQPIPAGFFMENYLPSFRWIDRLSGMSGNLEKKLRDLDSFCEELIEEHMNPNRPKSMDGDIIDVMLGMIRNRSSSSFHFTLDHIKALVLDILGGGSESTASVLVWVMTVLIKKPWFMKKVRGEIRQLVGNKKEMIDEEDIAKLPYMRAVIKETMRLFPPGPLLLPRETTEKFSINGYEIEAGTMVHINAWAIGRDPTKWENPNEFVPVRFLDTDLDVKGQNPELIPFGIGRRGCPGIEIGMSEVELALANLVYKFEWELPPGMKEEDIDFEAKPGLAIHKKNALRLVAKINVI